MHFTAVHLRKKNYSAIFFGLNYLYISYYIMKCCDIFSDLDIFYVSILLCIQFPYPSMVGASAPQMCAVFTTLVV